MKMLILLAAFLFHSCSTNYNDVELSDISEFEIKIYELCKSNNPEIIDSIKKTGKLDDEGDKNLSLLIEEFKKNFKK